MAIHVVLQLRLLAEASWTKRTFVPTIPAMDHVLVPMSTALLTERARTEAALHANLKQRQGDASVFSCQPTREA